MDQNGNTFKSGPIFNIDATDELQSSFNPQDFFIPGWKGEGLITASAVAIKNALSSLSIDARSLFFKSSSSSKSMKLQTYNEFVHYIEKNEGLKKLVNHPNDFWLHVQDDSSPLKDTIEEFIKIHCFRAVAIYLFRIKFILELSRELHQDIHIDILLNPLSFLNKIFKKDSSTELNCESLKINQYSWYRPSNEYKELLLKLKDSLQEVTLTELIKLISTPKDDRIYSLKNYSHSLSHLSFGLLINELLIKFPTWNNLSVKESTYDSNKVCLLPNTINTKFLGNHVSSLALSHWLAQDTNVKVSHWDNLICPEFKGQEFVDGNFLKYCQELQFLSFLIRIAHVRRYEIVPFICKIVKEKNKICNNDFASSQASFFNLENLDHNGASVFSRIILNLTDFPKTNPHHYLVQQILGQATSLKKDGIIYVFSNQKLFVPSHSERVELLLKEFKVEANISFESLKGKGEVPQFLYILTKRCEHKPTGKLNLISQKEIKEPCLSFEIKGTLSRFNKFHKIYEEFKNFMRLKNAITTPIYVHDIDTEISFEFHQDAIIEGKLVSSVSTLENGHLPHPSFFKNLTKSSVPLETFFHVDQIDLNEINIAKRNSTNEFLGLSNSPERKYPLLLIINQTNALNVTVELLPMDTLRAKINDYGTVYHTYFGLIPKKPMINLNVFREYFSSQLGHQIIQLQLSSGQAKIKAKLRNLLIPSFFGNNMTMPPEVENVFSILNCDSIKIKMSHPEAILSEIRKLKMDFDQYHRTYSWHILGLLSQFKQQTLLASEKSSSQVDIFSNPVFTSELLKLKTYPIYPKNNDVYVELTPATSNDLKLPLTNISLKNEANESMLILKHRESEIAKLHASPLINQFIKFVLQNAQGVKIADIITALKIPNHQELSSLINNTESITIAQKNILKEVELMISEVLRTQILN